MARITHRRVCEAFDRLFTTALHRCRVVLASRPFRAPSGIQGTRLTIRPLTEPQVRQVVAGRLTHHGFDPDELVRRVFADRPEFAPLLRNPFYAELLADYARRAGGALPKSAFDLFDQFVTSRLDEDQARVKEKYDVSVADLRAAARLLGHEMFAADRGLEVDTGWAVDRLSRRWPGRGAALVGGLSYSRFARLGTHERGKFSFVHRRFAEFFAVEVLRDKGNVPDLNQIPTDGRWRDGLVMFCGIAAPAVQAEVSGFCWDRVQAGEADLRAVRLSTAAAKEAVHCLRFLGDTFRSVPDALAGFRPALGVLVRDLAESKDALVAKFAADAIPLLDPADRGPAIVRAMGSPFAWVQESTVTACRALRDLDADTLAAIRVHYARKPFHVKLLDRREALFTLSLSEAFRPLRRAYIGDLIEGVIRVLLSAVVAGLVMWINTFAGWVLVAYLMLGLLLHSLLFGELEQRANSLNRITVQLAQYFGRDPVKVVTAIVAFTAGFVIWLDIRRPPRPDPTQPDWLDPLPSDFEIPKPEQPILFWVLTGALLFSTICDWPLATWVAGRVRRWRDLLTGWRWPTKQEVYQACRAVLVLAVYVGLMFLAYNIPENLSSIIVKLLMILGVIVGIVILAGVGWWAWRTYRDRRVLSRGVPEVAGPDLVFATLRELRRDRGRRAYLQTLLARRVKLPPGAAIPDPDPEVAKLLDNSRGLNEDWGKLREFWLNLSR